MSEEIESKHTPGPLTVALSKERPFDIETRDATGALVFRRHLPCTSADDRAPQPAPAIAEAAYQILSVKTTPSHVFRLRLAGNQHIVEKQPINQTTGKPWQASRLVFKSENGFKALREFNLAVKAASARGQKGGA